jgi:predicted molibdopterin-dependent oxidoreductase YjgC
MRIERRRMIGKHEGGSGEIMSGRLVRAVAPDAAPLRILIDGAEVEAYPDDSVLVAVLTARGALRRHEFGDEPRAGFCLMGACQDCWVWLADHSRVRACTTPVRDGMHVLTRAPQGIYQA